jgi:hypothetical protein
MLKNIINIILVGLTAVWLSACGGGGGDNVGTLNIAVTDASVDNVTEVWVQFDAVTLKPANGPQQYYQYDTPKDINLKALTNGKFELLLDEQVPAGEYIWIKLHVNAEENIRDSYVIEDGGAEIELSIPPDRLKLGNHFTVITGGFTAVVFDWNLRMGLTNPVGQPGYKLQPSLRITDMTEYGNIAGSVDPALLPPTNTSCTSDMNSGDGNVVYVYEGFDVIPDDVDNNTPNPLTTADVRLNIDTGKQEYMAPFLAPGEYTVAFTCQGNMDTMPDPDDVMLDVDDLIEFTPGMNAEVKDGLTTVADFEAPVPVPVTN